MRIQLSDHFTYKKLIRFVMPSIIMMIFTSIYSVVDGLFVSNFVGTIPFAALNLIYPLIMALGSIGFMLGAGGSAMVAKTLGEGRNKQANQYFSMIIYVGLILGVVLAVIGCIFVRPIALLLGATPEMIEDCVIYGRIILIALPAFMMQNMFQSFLVTAERPKIGLFITVFAGVTNIILDAVFVVALDMGLAGAALATALSQLVGGVIPFVLFIRKNNTILRLGKWFFNSGIMMKTCVNGSSELMTNLSASVVTILYNYQLLRLAGENGVAAYGVIMYAHFIFSAIFFGYAIASAPLISYHYGAGDHAELKNLLKKSLKLVGGTGAVLTCLALVLGGPLSSLFVGYDPELFQMTTDGFRIFAFCFVLAGFNVFGSAFFTALNNGVVSATISFLRTLVFQMAALLILPVFFGLNGVWFSIVVSEVLSLVVTVFFLVKERKKYHYA